MSALVWLSYGSLLALSILDCIRSPYFPDILNELHLDGTTGSLFFATTSLCAFLGSWLTHSVIEKKSSLFLMRISSLFLAIGFAWISVSPSLPLLLIACATFGFSIGGLNLAQNTMIVESAPPHLRRRIFSGLHSMYGLSALLAPVIASAFRWGGFTWRQCFATVAIFPLMVVFVSGKHQPHVRATNSRTPLLNQSEWSRCFFFALMMAGYLWGELSASTRMVLWLREQRGFSPDMANLFLAGFCFFLLLGRIVLSFVHFPRVGNWLILTLSAGSSAAAYYLALNQSPIWMLVLGLTMSPFFPIAMEQVSVSFGLKSTQALGFVIGAGSLSIVMMHVTVGLLTDGFGIERALMAGPAALAINFCVLTVLLFNGRLEKTPQMVELKSQ